MKKPTLITIQKEIDLIKARNQRVEKDKAWETSITRRVSVSILTYLTILIFFYTIGVEKPLISAIVPTLGFVISTMSLPFIKKLWLKSA